MVEARDPLLRFSEKIRIDLATKCWEWTAGKDKDGYGRHKVYGRTVFAHRWIYENLREQIPKGLVIDHLCRNPGCVNPWHMEPVTVLVNTRRGNSYNPDTCKRGHPWTKESTIWKNRKQRNGTIRRKRTCRICDNNWQRENYHKRKGEPIK